MEKENSMERPVFDKEYITGIQALNYHRYDWHGSCFDYTKSVYENAKELREWLGDFEIQDGIASSYRAFLDYLYHNIHFLKRVPNHTIDMFLFDGKEKIKLLDYIEKYLKPKLNREELILLNKWKDYNNGGEYDFTSKKSTNRKIRRGKRDCVDVDKIGELVKPKINTLSNRVVARDLYNIAFILNNYYERIKKSNENLLRTCYDLFAKDAVNTIIDYEDCFAEDKILDIEDLFLTAQRLERFKKTYETDIELSKKKDSDIEKNPKNSGYIDDVPGFQ